GAILQKSPPAKLAYIIYTSGSTGKPKGTLTTHANVIRVVRNTNYIELTEHDRVLQLSNYAFDGSVFDIYGALLNGATLISIDRETVPAANRLAAFILREQVTVFFVTTALFNTLVEFELTGLANIRKVLFGGERVSVEHSRRALATLGKGKIIHVYGPTETTVYATYYFIDHIDEGAVTIPIGKPIANTDIYILDKYLNPVPPGVPGEIYIGGDGVARGYLNNPELTSEKFNRSYRTHMTYICYKTGDLARWLPDGNIEFSGRIDQQVKIRGFRVELGEIENKLLCHESINEVFVTAGAREGEAGENQYLCAYIVSAHGIDGAVLADYLSGVLPAYMIPAYFIRLEKMPLTVNGKIDRKALPLPGVTVGHSYVAPANDIEEKLVHLWSSVLNIDNHVIGTTTNFFRLGGHSLKAAILINQIKKLLGIDIKMKEIFASPTVKGMAALILKTKAIENTDVQPVEKKDYYPLSAAQARLYVVQQMLKESTGYNMPVFFEVRGAFAKGWWEHIFLDMIKRHESLRTSFHLHPRDEQPVQRIHDEVEFEIEILGKDDPAWSSFIRPFDLTRAPLLRVGWQEVEGERHILMIDMHHIISDGLSIGIFSRDLKELARGHELPALKLQYKDFAGWQNELAASGTFKAQEQYWLDLFKDEIPVANLPTDFVRPAEQSFAGGSTGFQIGKKETLGLTHLGLKTGTTSYMILLATYNILLWKLTGQEDIVVGSPAAGRRHHDFEPIMGMFVNTLALRNNPMGDKPFLEFLAEVKESTLNAYENQDYQYEELVEKVVETRDMSRNPLFDVVFALENKELNGVLQGMELPGLVVTRCEYEETVSKFDLTLFAREAEEDFSFSFEYSTRLFKKETIARFSRYFKRILDGVLEDPGKPMSKIDMLADEEKRQLLINFNETRTAYPADKTIPQLFEEQVERAPDRVAVFGHGRTRTNTDNNVGADLRVCPLNL
ncbi:MAG TPA: amino acid adenylation domain-containing protein, partial [Candidatus Deferrimicrobium sp.]|nr:amino acid adenylation domain-containing protein [Candidatus Deferrimicrobium sp.]